MVTAASFSTSAHLSANPPKKGNSAQSGPPKRGVRALTIKKTKRAVSARPPAPGERKALRKRIVLSNTNALEVPGLQEMSASNVGDETFHGKMLALPGPVIDSLRVVEAFHTTQGWSMFRKPATLVRGDTVDLGKLMRELEEGKSTGRRVVVGEAHSGKSVLQLQALAMAFLREWVVVHISDGMLILGYGCLGKLLIAMYSHGVDKRTHRVCSRPGIESDTIHAERLRGCSPYKAVQGEQGCVFTAPAHT